MSAKPSANTGYELQYRRGRIALTVLNGLSLAFALALWAAIDQYAASRPAGSGFLDGIEGFFSLIVAFLPQIIALGLWVLAIGIADGIALIKFVRASEPWNLPRGLYFAVISAGALAAIFTAYYAVRAFIV